MSRTWLTLWCVVLGTFIAGTTVAQDQPDPRKWNIDPRMTGAIVPGSQTAAPVAVQEYVNPDATTRVIHGKDETMVIPPNIRPIPSTTITQSEVILETNPVNRNVMFGAANAYPSGPQQINEAWFFTTDNGATWYGSSTIAPGGGHGGDPGPTIDKDGRVIHSYLRFNGSSYTGVGVIVSTDNGTTWSAERVLTSSSSDKNLAGTDDWPSSPYYGRSYVVWSNFALSAPPIVVSYTTDGGTTWTAPASVNTPPAGHYSQGCDVEGGVGGVVYVVWAAPISGSPFTEDFYGFAKSTNGGVTWQATENAFDGNGIRGNFTFGSNSVRVNSFPRIAVDKSGGPRNGWIYVATCDQGIAPAGSDPDIILHRSTDGGTTWTNIRVNQDPMNNGRRQWFPAVCVDQAGGVNVAYYDSRATTTDSSTVYMSRSLDGGNTWTDLEVADHHFQPKPISGLAGGYQGDYIGIAASNGKVWPIWVDDRTGLYQIWTVGIVTTENFGWVKGTITNVNGGAPLQNVNVDFIETPNAPGFSDGSGFYKAGVEVDTSSTTRNVTMRARAFGFLDTLIAVTVTRNDTITRNFAMTPLDLVLTKADISFPPTPVPGVSRDSLVARNRGTGTLTLSSLTTTNPVFVASPGNATILAGDSLVIRVTYTPTTGGSDTGRVVIISNSVYTPRKDVLLVGTAIGVPLFTASVDSLSRTLEGGVQDSISFRLRNEGTTAGDFSARAIMEPRTTSNSPLGPPLIIPLTIEKTAAPSNVMQAFPELLYYKFNEAGGTATQNFANPGVGTNPAPVIGQTMGGSGQFGSALIGTGVANNYVNTGWNTALGTGGWTISMWLSNIPNNTSLYYLWGDNTAGSFRCFLGGAAGAGAITLRGTGIANVDVPGVAPGPTVVHFVYDPAAGNIKAYKNGTLVATVAQSALNINGTAPFRVGAYSTSAGLPSGGLMDEFRMYNRALSAGEIASTWNTELGGAWLSVGPTTGTIGIGDSVLMTARFDATDPEVYNNPGNYLGRIEVLATNSSLADTLRIPAHMFVIPPPGARISVNHDSLNFGDVRIGTGDTLAVRVQNIGAATLNVTNILMSNPNFSASPTSFTLASLDTQRVNVVFNAPFPANTYSGSMSFVSNDSLAPTIGLVGTSFGVPQYLVRVDSLTSTLEGGQRDSVLFFMRNDGTGTGNFQARAIAYPRSMTSRQRGKPLIIPVTIRPVSRADGDKPLQANPAMVRQNVKVTQPSLPLALTEGYDPSPTPTAPLHTSDVPQYYNFNTGGSANTFPFNVDPGKRIQWLFLPGDFSQPSPAPQGRIANVSFRIAVVGSGTFTDLTIMMGQSTITELPPSVWYSGPLQVVYSHASVSLSATTIGDWVTIPLDVPFQYDPTQSLIIDVNQCGRAGTGLSTFHTGITGGVRRNASLVGASCPLPYANTSTLVVHCGIDVAEGGNWFSVAPTEGTIAVGDSVLMAAHFDATDPSIYNDPGEYLGRLEVVATNSPLADTLRVPARLFVIPPPGPRLTTSPDSLSFGNVEIDSSRTLPLVVRNIGASALTVTNITTTDTSFSASPTSFTLATLETLSVNVRFRAHYPGGAYLGTLNFVSNDPSAPSVALKGISAGVAHFTVRPDTFAFSRQAGTDTTTVTFKIFSTGTDSLRYLVDESNILSSSGVRSIRRSVTRHTGDQLGKGDVDPRPAERDSSGGPDAFGYHWIDSDSPGGPIFTWVDITSVGTAITFTNLDDGNTSVPFPFSFSYYGTTYSGNINVCTNGWLSLTSTATSYSNSAIPSSTAPLNGMFPFWDDMNLNLGGTVYYYNDAANNRFIVEYYNVPHYTSGGPYTFEVILNPNGTILYQYLSMDPSLLNSATIGIQDAAGAVALQVVYNANYVHNNLAILITSDLFSWMSTEPSFGTIAPGDSQTVQLRIHPAGLVGGDFYGIQRISGNTTDIGGVRVGLHIVTGVGDSKDLVPTVFALRQNYPNPFNPTTQIKYDLPMQATVSLKIYNILGQEVVTLASGVMSPGYYAATWLGRNNFGAQVSSGVYFYSIEATPVDGSNTFRSIKKMLLLK